MSPLIESIHLLDGKFSNLSYHEKRMVRAWKELAGINPPWSLSEKLQLKAVPEQGLFKCRAVYDEQLISVEFTPYVMRPVRSLKLVTDDGISYDHKFLDRKKIDGLFVKRDDCDDILVIKDGQVTDTSFSNIAFKKGSEWFTPTSCLLPGTMRQKLLDEGAIRAIDIFYRDIRNFESFKLMNALILWSAPEISISQIIK